MWTPLVKISISLVMLTLSLALAGDMIFRLGSESHEPALNARKKICETLAVQISSLVSSSNIASAEASLNHLVKRNEDVLSAALRKANGHIIFEAGVHQRYWIDVPLDKSTSTHAQVPIFDRDKRWGTVEVRFTPLVARDVTSFLKNPFFQFLTFLALLGFVTYLFFMKKTLKHLDPSAVIPPRVRQTLDILTEGVVLLDSDCQVVMANSAFGTLTGRESAKLMGRKLSNMGWVDEDNNELFDGFPWEDAIQQGKIKRDIKLRLPGLAEDVRCFLASGMPMFDADNTVLGALVTFADTTELERKHEQLQHTVAQLKVSQDEIEQKNERLHILATRDPMTNCYNRRAFFEKLKEEFETASREGTQLCCIMADIDHFKSVNDTYGHAVGDKVIQQFADILRAGIRSVDAVGRYGGEEFCVLLPGLDAVETARAAETIRALTEETLKTAITGTKDRLVTASLGVASLADKPASPSDLVDSADKALYHSKTNGRNRVTRWDQMHEEQRISIA